MSTHKRVDIVAIVAVVLAIALCVTCIFGVSTGLIITSHAMGYEDRLFDTSKVHTIDIVMDDWETFLTTCQSEEYSVCTAIIDGEKYGNIGIRGKGNTSLSTVASLDSDRYSFKIEFDHYESGRLYHGLDKLCLNNIIQDNTYLKDYLTYQMMESFGADAPLCSYAYITVNGEDWGLYLAVEGVEDSFLQRNYGADYGDLYKPDSMSFGGGRGNGKDFDMENFDFGEDNKETAAESFNPSGMQGQMSGDFDPSGMQGQMPGDFDPSSMRGQMAGGFGPSGMKDQMPRDFDPSTVQGEMPENFDPLSMTEETTEKSEDQLASKTDTQGFNFDKANIPGFGGMGSSDVKLQYIDDDIESYSNIFDSAKTEVSTEDEKRLISTLKSLSEYKNLDTVLDIDEVLRYFVVHNFVVNGDSYTGSMIHNYYLYEENGQLSMIPWDYNLAYGTFQGNNASEAVNDAIDEVLSDRPMQAWIFSNQEYTNQYHELMQEFINTIDISNIIETTKELIASYVEKDPTAFCTYVEFVEGVEALQKFVALRKESVQGQLDGSIPSTDSGRTEQTTLIDVGELDLSTMGTMSTNGGGKGGFENGFQTFSKQLSSDTSFFGTKQTNQPAGKESVTNGKPQQQ